MYDDQDVDSEGLADTIAKCLKEHFVDHEMHYMVNKRSGSVLIVPENEGRDVYVVKIYKMVEGKDGAIYLHGR